MRGIALSALLTKLKKELRDAQETNTHSDQEYYYALADMQQTLAGQYDWPFLEDKWNLTMAAGTRYYALPTSNIRSIASTINFERPVKIENRFNSFYHPLDYGIGEEQMNATNSDDGVRQDPVQRWSLDTNLGDSSNPNEIEVWPIPASTQVLRITGQRNVRTLAAAGDLADLDDLLIVFHVAADYLALRQQLNASMVANKAANRLALLRGNYPRKTDPIVFGANQYPMKQERVKLIAVT